MALKQPALDRPNTLSGFSHFSYQVDWSNFPNSLAICCHLKGLAEDQSKSLLDQQALLLNQQALLLNQQETLAKIVQTRLLKQGIKLKNFRNNIIFKTV